jgi:hypothetical protein
LIRRLRCRADLLALLNPITDCMRTQDAVVLLDQLSLRLTELLVVAFVSRQSRHGR